MRIPASSLFIPKGWPQAPTTEDPQGKETSISTLLKVLGSDNLTSSNVHRTSIPMDPWVSTNLRQSSYVESVEMSLVMAFLIPTTWVETLVVLTLVVVPST